MDLKDNAQENAAKGLHAAGDVYHWAMRGVKVPAAQV